MKINIRVYSGWWSPICPFWAVKLQIRCVSMFALYKLIKVQTQRFILQGGAENIQVGSPVDVQYIGKKTPSCHVVTVERYSVIPQHARETWQQGSILFRRLYSAHLVSTGKNHVAPCQSRIHPANMERTKIIKMFNPPDCILSYLEMSLLDGSLHMKSLRKILSLQSLLVVTLLLRLLPIFF